MGNTSSDRRTREAPREPCDDFAPLDDVLGGLLRRPGELGVSWRPSGDLESFRETERSADLILPTAVFALCKSKLISSTAKLFLRVFAAE